MNKKVLIIEDESVIALDLYNVIAGFGYQVEMAGSFEEAMSVTKRFSPDLILSDINLNEPKTGIDCIREIRKNFPDTEVIYLTAYIDKEFLEAAERTGSLNYIVKPYNASQIEVALQLAFNFINKKARKNDNLKKLSHSELRVVELIAQEKTSKEIAEMLFLSEKTVRNHRYNIGKKLNLEAENNSVLMWAVRTFRKHS